MLSVIDFNVLSESVCAQLKFRVFVISFPYQDICSLECKARHLKTLGIIVDGPDETSGWSFGESGRGGGGGVWRYKEHPEVASWSEEYVNRLRTKVNI